MCLGHYSTGIGPHTVQCTIVYHASFLGAEVTFSWPTSLYRSATRSASALQLLLVLLCALQILLVLL